MNITLNKNSWHFRIYKSLISDNPPKSLCPYFWSLVSVLLLSPVILPALGIIKLSDLWGMVKSKHFKQKKFTIDDFWELENKKQKRRDYFNKILDKVYDVIKFIFLWIILPIMVVGFIYVLYDIINTKGWYTLFQALLVYLIIFSIIGVIASIIIIFGGRISDFLVRFLNYINPLKWSISIIIGGMVHSVYKKTCPIINWEGDLENKEVENHLNQ